MIISKAIEILDQSVKDADQVPLLDLVDAMKLGLEALKCVQKIRHHPFPDEVLKLPGETPRNEK